MGSERLGLSEGAPVVDLPFPREPFIELLSRDRDDRDHSVQRKQAKL